MQEIKSYIKQLVLEGGEMANRTALENLLNIINNSLTTNCNIVQDPRSQNNTSDQIDFIISHENNEIAFIETKKILESNQKKVLDINKIIDGEQINRYKKHKLPIILTNYIDFIFIDGDIVSEKVSIAKVVDYKIKIDKSFIGNYQTVYNFIIQLFNSSPAPITKVSSLANRLALASQKLKLDIAIQLEDETSSIYGVYKEFINLIGDTTLDDFASTYAETIAYGLLMIRLQNEENVSKESLIMYDSLGVIQNLAMAILNCGKDIEYTINNIITIINLIDKMSIQKELEFSVGNDKDPYIYLYEDFLQIYDIEQKQKRGVYYTPLPVVDYIIRSIDYCLKEKLSVRKGLKDSRIKILDFASGTGTFILEAIRLVLKNESLESQKTLIKEHIIPNFYAFEYLMAPYAVAHLKIRNYLYNIIGEQVSPQILLTNTLHNTEFTETPSMLTSLMEEGKTVRRVKDKEKIIAIIGNPPYSGHSANKDIHITNWDGEIKDSYTWGDNKKLDEKNPKWLNDDYVKFIRFAQWKITQVDKGVIGLITNHGFLDNPTFRGMRESLMKSFDEMYFLDLHGNSKKKEKTPTGEKDENIFPIEQGTAILILIKNSDLNKNIYSSDIWGLKEDKFNFLKSHDITNTDWNNIKPVSKIKYLFKEVKMNKKYSLLLKLEDIFKKNSTGLLSKRDHFAIAFSKEEIENRLKDFIDKNLSNEFIADKYKLKDTRDWKLDKSRENAMLMTEEQKQKLIQPIDYRIFDKRWTVHNKIWQEFNVTLSFHMKNRNIALLSTKQYLYSDTCAFISNNLVDINTHVSRGGTSFFPLYLYDSKSFIDEPISNIKESALKEIESFYKKEISDENIFYYIYGVLHHPTYRKDFGDLLRIDFPQIPFVENYDLFLKYSDLGEKLSKCHLLESFADNLVKHNSKGDIKVVKISYSAETESLYYNDTAYFAPVPEYLWDLQIGGYQVLKSWLESRKGRVLSIQESQKFEDIVCALIKAEDIIQNIGVLEL